MSKTKSEELSLEFVNKQIAEIKKRFQLLEGQRNAHYEMWDSEKKKNNEKIKQLKENIKKMYTDLTEQTNVKKNVKICGRMVFRKGRDKALESLDQKVIETRKKLDLLQHEINQKQERIYELSSTKCLRKKNNYTSKWIIPCPKTITTLENKIHKVEINIMEAEHLRKKYRSIKNHLSDESIGYESTLKKLEEKINQQENEISNLQKTYAETVHLRDMTYESLQKQENDLQKIQQERETEMEHLKLKVDSYKLELERIERHMYPEKGSTLEPQQNLEQDDSELNKKFECLENVFGILKEATGVIDNGDVLRRFLSQKDTRNALENMKLMCEREKHQLLKQKEEIIAELETYKFSDLKEQEKDIEEIEVIHNEIQKETENYSHIKEEYDQVQEQLKSIMSRIHSFCLQLKNFDVANVPKKCPSVEKCEWLLQLFRTKIESASRHARSHSGAEKKEKSRNVEMWAALPFSMESRLSDDEEEEEIPTRNSLKREAQLIYEARSRRRAYKPAMGK